VFFNNKTTISVSESFAEKFRDWLAEKLEPVTVRERMVLMNPCWVWGLKKKLVVENPWPDVRVIVAPKQNQQPFTLTEISAIAHKFRSDPHLNHYADYVEFKFGRRSSHWGSCCPPLATLFLQLRSPLDPRKFE
jgi:integrase